MGLEEVQRQRLADAAERLWRTLARQVETPLVDLARVGDVLLELAPVVWNLVGDPEIARCMAEAAGADPAIERLNLDSPSPMTLARGLVRTAAALDQAALQQGEVWSGWVPSTFEDGRETCALRWAKADADVVVTRQQDIAELLPHHRVLRNPDAKGIWWDIADRMPGTNDPTLGRLGALRLARPELLVVVWTGGASPVCTPHPAGGEGMFDVGPTSPTGDEELLQECAAAARAASDVGASILVLPELFIPSGALDQTIDAVTSVPRPPPLTVVGLAHQVQSEGEGRLNEAVVFGQDRSVLWRHTKTHRYQGKDGGPIGEVLVPGVSLSLRWTELGWVALAICLELFAPDSKQALSDAAPRLVMVPSLSPTVSAHLSAAKDLSLLGTACAVANWPIDRQAPIEGGKHPFPFVWDEELTAATATEHWHCGTLRRPVSFGDLDS